MKYLILILAVSAGLANAAVSPNLPMEECKQHLPFGKPVAQRTDVMEICRPGYALLHDNRAKIPMWVAYELTQAKALGCAKRESGFEAEPSLPSGRRAETKDYAKSGYDIGHMANSGDARWSEQASDDSNVLSNAAPQKPGLNRGAWKTLENQVRSWAIERDHLIIYVGPIYSAKGVKTIGKNQVVVPDAFFKVVIDPETRETMSFIYPHEDSKQHPAAFITSLAEIQRRTGIVFLVPQRHKGVSKPWPILVSSSSEKSVACSTR